MWFLASNFVLLFQIDFTFAGQNECVSVINTYITLDEIDKLVHPKGKNSAEVFPSEFCSLLHATTRTHHIHPIKVWFFELTAKLGAFVFLKE